MTRQLLGQKMGGAEGPDEPPSAMATTFALNLQHFVASNCVCACVSVCVFAIMYNLNVNNLAQRGKGSRGIKSSK